MMVGWEISRGCRLGHDARRSIPLREALRACAGWTCSMNGALVAGFERQLFSKNLCRLRRNPIQRSHDKIYCHMAIFVKLIFTRPSVELRHGAEDSTSMADSKEQFGGCFLIDLPDLDAALSSAARCPATEQGVVKVRALGPCSPASAGCTRGERIIKSGKVQTRITGIAMGESPRWREGPLFFTLAIRTGSGSGLQCGPPSTASRRDTSR
jgi:hypothetical protein